jgi:hypothetical protein
MPPLSSPGTGTFAIARRSTNIPYPANACDIGTKVFQILIPALLFMICISLLISRTLAASPLASFIFLVRGSVSGLTTCNLDALSAASMYGLNRTARTTTAERAIDTHHGVPAYTCTCSRSHSIHAVGPRPKSSPRDFKYPMCSGISWRNPELKSVASSREEVRTSGGGAVDELKVSEGVEAAAEVEIGVVEAKRSPAPFRIKRFPAESENLERMPAADAPFLERSRFDLIGAFCTMEEEN